MIQNKTFFAAVIGLLATMAVVGFISIRPVPVVVETNLENLPMEIVGYRGIEDSFPETVYRELNADKHIYRHYVSGDGNQIDLYIGYYGTAKGGRSTHNPYACLPGAGWAIVDAQKVHIRPPSQLADVEVNYVRAIRDGANIVMIHWYQSSGSTVMSTGFKQNMERFWGRLLHNRNDGAFVQITAPATDSQLPAAKAKVQEFSEQILQLLPAYWPTER